MTNPYQTPETAAQPTPVIDYSVNTTEKRPTVPMVFGVLSLVFAAFGVFSIMATVGLFYAIGSESEFVEDLHITNGMLVLSLVMNVIIIPIMIIAGIGLIKYRVYGKRFFTIYAVLLFITVLATMFMLINAFGTSGMAIDIGSNVLSLIFPVLGLIFLNSDRVKASLK